MDEQASESARRLAAFHRQNQLDLALQELGRIERTLFMLDWLESPQLRQLCTAGLNKSEQRHALAQVICTYLVIAAIVHWNSTYVADAVDHLCRQRLDARTAHP